MAKLTIQFKDLEVIINKVPLTIKGISNNSFKLVAECLKKHLGKDLSEGNHTITTKIFRANNIFNRDATPQDKPSNWTLHTSMTKNISKENFNICEGLFDIASIVYEYNDGNISEAKWYKVEWYIDEKIKLTSTEKLHYNPYYGGGGGGSDDYWTTPGD